MYDTFSKEKLGERIKSIRKKRWEQYKSANDDTDRPYKKYKYCKNQSTLAKKIGVERRAISSWELGTNSPSIKNLIELSNALDCGVDYFFGAMDYMEIAPVAFSAYHSGISSDIINYARNNSEYLNFLNFFMHPENIGAIFNKVTISTWRQYIIDASLERIKEPLKSEVYKAYDEYRAINLINDVSIESYEAFLKQRFPENKIILKKEKHKNGFFIKESFDVKDYQSFFDNNIFNYPKFIRFLAEVSFEPLSHNALIEIQKENLAKLFCTMLTNYIEQDIKE